VQLKTNDWLAQENAMLEEYLRRVHPSIDPLDFASKQGKGKVRKGADARADAFALLTADEKSNICSHQIDAALQALAEVEQKGQDEISEARSAASPSLLACCSICSGSFSVR
jgi:hypothetical protein